MSQIAEKHPSATFADSDNDVARAVIAGLSRPQKTLPCFLFYDRRGSQLFEQITEQPEYYPTRTEAEILRGAVGDIAAHTPPGSLLVEFGSGSSRKTEILLQDLPSLAAYVPIDVSQSALGEACERLSGRFPRLRIIPSKGDFNQPLILPQSLVKRPRLGFFPGSTIGNFAPDDARELLAGMAQSLGPAGRLIIGVDLRKDSAILVPAYNDAAGVTADFNLNLLVRLNNDLGANFNLDRFAHRAIFNAAEGRVEMHIVSLETQTARVCGLHFDFSIGESIHTENSYKYTISQFQALASQAGWLPRQVWTDPKDLFSLHELTATY
jgi:dimethylhistidine N-methyltransferase